MARRRREGAWLCSYPTCRQIVDRPCRCHLHGGGKGWSAWDDEGVYATSAWRRARTAQLGEHPVCQRCGSREQISVHHRNSDARDHRLSNLETLCSSCHHAATADRRRQLRLGEERGRRDEGSDEDL
jgi:hypothetical protein